MDRFRFNWNFQPRFLKSQGYALTKPRNGFVVRSWADHPWRFESSKLMASSSSLMVSETQKIAGILSVAFTTLQITKFRWITSPRAKELSSRQRGYIILVAGVRCGGGSHFRKGHHYQVRLCVVLLSKPEALGGGSSVSGENPY